MTFEVFLNFDGDCRKAVEFYAGVFGLNPPSNIMTYGEHPEGDFGKENENRILFTKMPIFGCDVMFSDCPAGSHYAKGTNVALSLGTFDAGEIKRIFDALAERGHVETPLGETFFSALYGMVTDKFGITWQLSLTTGANTF